MSSHQTGQIRNVALLGHGGVGKTTLAEAMLHKAGLTNRVGAVDDGTTVLDRDPEEIDRGSTITLGLASFDWTATDGNDYRINLLDTPGHPDFEAEVDAALAVTDLAVLVVSAVDGVEVGTEAMWRKCVERDLPRMIFITREGKQRANFERVLQQLRDVFGSGFTPLELPLGEAETFHGIADVLTEQAFEFDEAGERREEPMPDDIADHEHELHDQAVEDIVSGDDEQLERYLEGDEPSAAELERTLAREVLAREEFPVLCGSGTSGIGVGRLADYICELGPSPADRPVTVHAGDQEVEVAADQSGDPLLCVFKTVSDQYVGQISMFKVVSGTLRPDMSLRDLRTGNDERLHALFHVLGAAQTQATKLVAGDLGAVTKLADVETGTTLAPPNQPATVPPVQVPVPHLNVALIPETQSDDDKLSDALHRLLREDPSLATSFDERTRRTVLRALGDTHLDVALSRLERKFGVSVSTAEVAVPYRRTISKPVDIEGRVKKQSGGHGQFAVVNLRISPLPRGEGFLFVDKIVGGAIPKQYISAVRAGVEDAMRNDLGDGVDVVDVEVQCIDGKTHSVDSSDMAFKTAAASGFNEAVRLGDPLLLEPISLLTVRVPAENQGDVLGDLNSRRGKIIGSITEGDGVQVITAAVPTAEVSRYAMDLRAMTAARGQFEAQHDHYEPVPQHLVSPILAGLE